MDRHENYMSVKDWLLRGYRIDARIKSKLELIEMWSSYGSKLAVGADKATYNEPFRNQAQIADAKAEIESEEEELIGIKLEITAVVRKVKNPACRLLLEQRYLLCKKWQDIAEDTGYSKDHLLKTLHPYALIEVEKYIQKYQLRAKHPTKSH